MGIITNCNNEVNRLLGYTKPEIIGESVDMIMPKIYADYHTNFMLSYFDKDKGKAMNNERMVYSMSKDGYIIPCTLLIKVLPSLFDGIQIVGFLKEKESENILDEDKKHEDNYILYGEPNGMVYGVTKSCFNNFSIRSSLTYGKCPNMSELTLEMIAPEVLEPKNLDDYKSNSGVLVTLDTTVILQNYPFDDDDENDDLEQEKIMLKKDEACEETDHALKNRKYRRVPIRAF